MTYKPARLDDVGGFAVAHVEKHLNEKQLVVAGTFKGERTFFQENAYTSRKMIYRGFVEDEGTLYYVEVPVTVQVRVRLARFRSDELPNTLIRTTYD